MGGCGGGCGGGCAYLRGARGVGGIGHGYACGGCKGGCGGCMGGCTPAVGSRDGPVGSSDYSADDLNSSNGRICSGCQKLKPRGDFSNNQLARSVATSRCNDCVNAANGDWDDDGQGTSRDCGDSSREPQRCCAACR